MDIYARLQFPPAPPQRPYVFLNMIATIDGKILSGNRDESVHDLGSKTDKLLMKRIEAAADAVMLGAQTLRATPTTWSPQSRMRVVVTRSGDIPLDHAFLSGDAWVATPGNIDFEKVIRFTTVEDLLQALRSKGVERLLCMGGSVLNAQLFEADSIDEIFLTLAPKVKLGEDVPTIADGSPLSKDHLLQFALGEHHAVGDELFLRYVRARR